MLCDDALSFRAAENRLCDKRFFDYRIARETDNIYRGTLTCVITGWLRRSVPEGQKKIARGAEPLEQGPKQRTSPEGAKDLLSPLRGYGMRWHGAQGLTPLAIVCRRFAADPLPRTVAKSPTIFHSTPMTNTSNTPTATRRIPTPLLLASYSHSTAALLHSYSTPTPPPLPKCP
jgi:hypothetical protein